MKEKLKKLRDAQKAYLANPTPENLKTLNESYITEEDEREEDLKLKNKIAQSNGFKDYADYEKTLKEL